MKTPKRRTVKKSTLTAQEELDLAEVLLLVQKILDSTREVYKNPWARKAAHERIVQTGFAETVRILKDFQRLIDAKAPFRPSFDSPTILLTAGWGRIITFLDHNAQKKGNLKITDRSIKDKIIQGLKEGGFKPRNQR